MFIFEMPIHAASAATNTDFQQMSAQLAFCHLSQVALQKIFPDKTFFADILEIFCFVIFIIFNLQSRGKISCEIEMEDIQRLQDRCLFTNFE